MESKVETAHFEDQHARQNVESTQHDPEKYGEEHKPQVVDDDAVGYVNPDIVITEEESLLIRRKIHRMVLPIMCIAYFTQSCDKGTLAPASIMGWKTDVGAVGNDYALATTVFYCGIVVGEPLANQAVRLFPIAKLLGVSMICWTALVLGLTFCLNIKGVWAIRFFLGFFESTFGPALVSITVQWYTKEEQPFVTAVWQACFALASIVMSFFGWAFYHIDGKAGGLRGWQWMTLAVTIISALCTAIILLFLPDSPTRARWADDEYKVKLVERIRRNDQGLKHKQFKWHQFWEAVRDPLTYLLFLHSFIWSMPNGGVNVFNQLLVNQAFGFDVLTSQLLNMPVGALQAAMYLISAWVIKKTQETCLVVVGLCIFPIIGSIVLLCVPPGDSSSTKGGLLVAFYLLQLFQAVYPTIWIMLSRNVAGQSKKSIVYATTFIAWAGGQAIGPQIFQAKWAPRYLQSLAIHLALYGALIIVVLGERFLLIRRNKSKDAAQRNADGVVVNTNSQAFDDLTDLENPDFRYSI